MHTTRTTLELIDTATSKGEGGMNEDLAGGVGPYAWMFDGATDMPATFRPQPDVTGAYWIAHRGNAWLRANARGQEPHELLTELAAAIDVELRSSGMPSGALPPAAGLAVVRADGDHVTVAAVGDVAVYDAAHDDLVLDTRFGSNEHGAVAQSLPPDDETAGIVARRRSYLGDPRTAWILGNNPSAGSGALRRAWPAAPGDHVLLATDGFARAVTDYGLATSWADLTDQVRTRGVAHVIDRLRAHEADARRTTFFKKSDDACAALYRCA